MFTYNERDMHRMPTPSRTHLPVKQFIIESGILPGDSSSDSNSNEHDQADIALLRLPAPNLKGTWKKAYDLLTQIVAQVGWDELLRTRSEVFVMEEEYRMQKQLQEGGALPGSEEPGSDDIDETGADDNASTRALRASVKQDNHPASPGATALSKKRTPTNGSISPAEDSQKQSLRSPEPPASPIPEIRISEHSDEDEETSQEKKEAHQAAVLDDGVHQSTMDGPAPGVDKPATTHQKQAQDGQEDNVAKEVGSQEAAHDELAGDQTSSQDNHKQPSSRPSLVDKRLCERWLDNLFMVLYEVRLAVSRSPIDISDVFAASSPGSASLYDLAV